MEKLKKKHNHKATKALQIVIFFIMMLAPLIAVGAKCGYTILNPNAKDSYTENYIQATKKLTTTAQLVEGQQYTLKYNNNLGNVNTSSNVIFYSSISIDWTDYGAPSGNNYNGFFTYKTNSNNYLYLKDGTTTVYTFWNSPFGTSFNEITFTASEDLTLNGNQNWDAYTTIMQKETLDNVFYISTNQLNEEPLFNWTKSTAIYTGINTMLTGLDIGTGTTTLAILLTYWALMTAIYIVFDIIIFCFTKLTHLIQ